MKKLLFLFSALFLYTSSASAAIIVTLIHDGSNGVVAHLSGTGTANPHNIEPAWIGATDIGEFVTSNVGPGFNLESSIEFTTGVNVFQLIIDNDGIGNDDTGLYLDDAFAPGSTYNLSGSSKVTGLNFSDLIVGTYSTQQTTFGGEFILNIQDAPVGVPAPGILSLFALGLLALRRKA